MAIFNIRPKAEGEAHEPLRLSLNSFLRLTQQDGMLKITGEGDYFLINRNISELYADIAIELQAVDESGADKGEPVYMPFWKSLHCTPNYGYTFFNVPTAAFARIYIAVQYDGDAAVDVLLGELSPAACAVGVH